MEVELSDVEIGICRVVAAGRIRSAKGLGLRRECYGGDSEKSEVLGAMGEMAFCKANNIYWEPKVSFDRSQPDVLPHYEIRTAKRARDSLIVRSTDDPTREFVLVVPSPTFPRFRIAGWILGAEAQGMSKYLYDDNAWFIPQLELQNWVGLDNSRTNRY